MRITCVHQGYELYGSDRSFAESVRAIRRAYPAAEIDVVLPRDGPIVAILAPVASRIVFEPIWVLRRRDLSRLVTVGLPRLPAALARAARRFRASDLVYVNTSVILDYMLVARLFPGKALLHVHEIPEGPVLKVLRALALWTRAEVVFNSQATRAAFALPPTDRRHVIYNGVAGPERAEPTTYDGTRPLRILLLGRISRIKGQEVLVEAVRLMPEARGRLAVRMIGGAFEDDAKERALRDLVEAAGLGDTVAVRPFTSAPEAELRWADVVVVPSRRPESLGRVAIEAMAFGRPPIVSAIGGLGEVVVDGETGWLVAPGRPEDLAAALRAVLADPGLLLAAAAPARARYEALFSERAASDAIGSVLRGMMGKRGAHGTVRPGSTIPDHA